MGSENKIIFYLNYRSYNVTLLRGLYPSPKFAKNAYIQHLTLVSTRAAISELLQQRKRIQNHFESDLYGTMSMLSGVSLVTGAGSGIGQSCAIELVRNGSLSITIADRSQEGLSQTRQLLNELNMSEVRICDVIVDVSKEEDVKDMVRQTVNRFGTIDFAINCAGVSRECRPSDKESSEGFDKVISTNLRGVWLCSRYELVQMKGQSPVHYRNRHEHRGSIINVSSQMGLVSMAGIPAYSAAKSGIIGFTRTDAIDYAGYGIRCNTLCPGPIDTPMSANPTNVDMCPMKRRGLPEEVADAAVFLASPRSSYVTGTSLVVDGGYICV